MRITTHMLNESARKAGLPINNISLLNYVKNGSTNNSLLETINRKNETTTDAITKSDYENLDKEADQLKQAAELFLQEGENNPFEQAKTSGDNQKVYDGIEKFFKSYNNTVKALKDASNTMNDFYREMLAEASEEVEKNLADIGITFAKDGTAKVNMEKVKAADIGTLEGLLGKDSKFINRVEFLSTRISDNAEANVKSVSSAYNASGNMYDAMSSSRYDLWG